jgi:tripartite-type tricarboxylate transporter receptor subunit TctC
MKRILEKAFVVFALCAVLAGCSKSNTPEQGGQAASADKYPEHPITLVVVQAPGGATDAGARVWQAFVEKELGVPMNFEFKPGANGEIGLTVLANAVPDGYTLGVSDSMTVTTSLLMQTPKYTMDNFEFLVTYFRDPGIIMAHKDEPYNTLSELIAYAKARPPETLSLGVAAMNDLNVIAVRQLEEATGVKFNIVNFNGGGKARTALAGHQIPLGAFMYYGSTTIKEETKILSRSVANTNVAALKNKETHSQVAGRPLDDIFSFNQIMAPAGFKEKYPARYQYVIEAFKRALNSPEFQANLQKLDQVEWLDQVYGSDNDAYNKERVEFGTRVAPLISGN